MNNEELCSRGCSGCNSDLSDHDDSWKPREECAVFGIYGHQNAAEMTYLGLYALQHRGQESTV